MAEPERDFGESGVLAGGFGAVRVRSIQERAGMYKRRAVAVAVAASCLCLTLLALRHRPESRSSARMARMVARLMTAATSKGPGADGRVQLER